MSLQAITTEIIIPIGEHKTVYSSCLCRIRVDDQAAGPYLVITGENDEPDKDCNETGHEFFLQSMDEIDEFAEICRGMLKQAQDIGDAK